MQFTDCNSCSPSSRLIVSSNGENPPAWILLVPVVNVGLNGRLAPGHGLPFGPVVTSNVEADSTVAVSDHGVNAARRRVRPTARGGRQRRAFAAEEVQSMSSNGVSGRKSASGSPAHRGSCWKIGSPSKCVVNWPVTGVLQHFAGRLRTDPDTGSTATTYIASRLPNGLVFCVARYAAPSSALGSIGVLIFPFASFAASGHAPAAPLCSAISSIEHANRPIRTQRG